MKKVKNAQKTGRKNVRLGKDYCKKQINILPLQKEFQKRK